jgi:sortase (surface protein transpeptidase)
LPEVNLHQHFGLDLIEEQIHEADISRQNQKLENATDLSSLKNPANTNKYASNQMSELLHVFGRLEVPHFGR